MLWKLNCSLPQFASAQKPFLPFQHVVVVAPVNTSNSVNITKRSHKISVTNFAFCCVVSLAYVLPQSLSWLTNRFCLFFKKYLNPAPRPCSICSRSHFLRITSHRSRILQIQTERKKQKTHLSICMCGVAQTPIDRRIRNEMEWSWLKEKRYAMDKSKSHTTYDHSIGRNLQATHAHSLPPMHETEICCSLWVAVSRSFHNSLICVLCV